MKGAVSISKAYGSREDDKVVRIRVTDDASSVEFAVIEMTVEDFALAVFGLSHVPADFTLRSPELVGKTRIISRRQVVCPLKTYDRAELAKWLAENCQEPGWLLDTYLGAQNSVVTVDGKTILNYSVRKFIEPVAGGAI